MSGPGMLVPMGNRIILTLRNMTAGTNGATGRGYSTLAPFGSVASAAIFGNWTWAGLWTDSADSSLRLIVTHPAGNPPPFNAFTKLTANGFSYSARDATFTGDSPAGQTFWRWTYGAPFVNTTVYPVQIDQ